MANVLRMTDLSRRTSTRQRGRTPDQEKPSFAHAVPVLRLQQAAGNRAVAGLVRHNLVQAKPSSSAPLTVGRPNDPYELQADRVAADVVRHLRREDSVSQTRGEPRLSVAGPDAVVQRQEWPEEEELMMRRDRAIPTIQRQDIPEEEELMLRPPRATPAIQRQDALEEEEWVSARGKEPLPSLQLQIEEEEEEELLQPSRSPGADAVGVSSNSGPDGLHARLGLARGGGQALDPAVKGSYERAFGHDFSRVHIHTNTEADALAVRLQAEAFTTGDDIFFRAGRYHPQSEAGRFLLAHELTHVVQQSE